MKTLNFILIVIWSVCLSQCTSKKVDKGGIDDNKVNSIPAQITPLNNFQEYPRANSIYGEWKYQTDNIFYSARLLLNRDSTFKYYAQSCFGKYFTEGRWKNDGIYVILNSLDKYKEVPLAASETVERQSIKAKKHSKTNSTRKLIIDSLIFDQLFMNVNVTVISADTTNIYFESKAFKFEGGLLYDLTQDYSSVGGMFLKIKYANDSQF